MKTTISSKIISYKKAKKISDELKKQGKKIIFKSGCFDIFHIGHAKALSAIKRQADVLFVGVGSDITLRALKGSDRPIFPEKYRAELIAHLEAVDYVVILKEPLRGSIDHEKIISTIRPDYYSLPPTDKVLNTKKAIAKKYGTKIKFQKELKSRYNGNLISSTDLFKRLKSWD